MRDTLYDYKPEDYAALLGGTLEGSTERPVAQTGLGPDPNKRTLFIAVGGSGVKTLNRLKTILTERMVPSWRQTTAFLAIDHTSELEAAKMLDAGECINVFRRSELNAAKKSSDIPTVLEKIVPGSGDEILHFADMLTGRDPHVVRLAGKLRIHDREAGKYGVDEEIVMQIRHRIQDMARLPSPNMGYDVFVIASCAGSLGAGAFLEIPPLVREALGNLPNPVRIYGMLYLPDLIAGINPSYKALIEANGYATLKELNYYQGMVNRPGYSETWVYRSAEKDEIRIPGETGLFETVHLIGCPDGFTRDAWERSREMVSEYLFQLVADKQHITVDPGSKQGCLDKPVNAWGLECPGCAHEFPRHFSSVGIARAAAPENTIRAYAVKRALEKSGMHPVSAEARAAIQAAGGMLPFAGADQYQGAVSGTLQAKELLKPLEKLYEMVNSGKFNLAADLKLAPEELAWENLVENGMLESHALQARTDSVIAQRTDRRNLDRLRDLISDQYSAYRKNVEAYVKQHGPFAFVNLYHGKFLPDQNNFGLGIKDMLTNLLDGKTMEGRPLPVRTVEQAEQDLREASQALENPPGMKLLGIRIVPRAHKERLTADWVWAKERLAGAEINQRRREMVYGQDGALAERFCKCAEELTHQIQGFAYALETLYQIYHAHGSVMEDPEFFRDAVDSLVSVNAAGMDESCREWLIRGVERDVDQIDPRAFRNELLESFFADPKGWMEVPEDLVAEYDWNRPALVRNDDPVPARRKFDQVVDRMLLRNVDTSLYGLFAQADPSQYHNMADKLIRQLRHRSQLCFRGTPDPAYVYEYVEYPAALAATGIHGPRIVSAIHRAARNCGIPAGNINPVANSDAIVMIQQATSMEIYRIAPLQEWEDEWERRACYSDSGLHGKSPDVTCVISRDGEKSYREDQTWAEYPTIVYRENYEDRDPVTGRIRLREGECRAELRKQINHLRELGLLYSEHTYQGWIILGVTGEMEPNLKFDVHLAAIPDEPVSTGKDLVLEVLKQNDAPTSKFIQVIRLEGCGIFSQPAPTEEQAWDNALRVLRAHHPMFCQIRRNVEIMEAWHKECLAYNLEVTAYLRPRMMLELMRAGIITRNPIGIWEWERADRTRRAVARFANIAIDRMVGPLRRHLKGGLVFFELFRSVDPVMPGDILVQEHARAKKRIEEWVKAQKVVVLELYADAVAVFEEEYEALCRMGMSKDPEAKTVSEAFVRAMEGVEEDREVLLQIQQFYARAFEP